LLSRDLPDTLYVLGFSLRKRLLLRRFVPQADLIPVCTGGTVPRAATVVAWGATDVSGLPLGARLVRAEDGFLRSVGLGAELSRPLSWVFDQSGLHFDATRPSDLETRLQAQSFAAPNLARARALRERLVAAGVTKYGVGSSHWQRPEAQRVLLVTGQVESDASLRLGAPGVRTNLDLLQAVRAENPHAHLVYKPHPDVAAGLRLAGPSEHDAIRYCDSVVADVGLQALLPHVDGVHVLTSLSGFEALLRGVPVTCHGLPFYAGWGLTDDRLALARRTRRLSLDELVAGALIDYPTYVSTATVGLSTPEQVLEELIERQETRTPVTRFVQTLRRGAIRLAMGAS
jgi:capsular polysaccharide export protein